MPADWGQILRVPLAGFLGFAETGRTATEPQSVFLADKTRERRRATSLIPFLLAVARTEALLYHAEVERGRGARPGLAPTLAPLTQTLLSRQPSASPAPDPAGELPVELTNCSSHGPDPPLWTLLPGLVT